MHFYIMTISSLREAAVQMQLLPSVHVYLLISDKEKKLFGKKSRFGIDYFRKEIQFIPLLCVYALSGVDESLT